MKRLLMLVFPAVVLLLSELGQASTPSFRLTRENIADQYHVHVLVITADDVVVVGGKRFTVRIKHKDRKVPTEIGSGYLEVRDGDNLIVSCPAHAYQQDQEAVFEFVVSPNYLERSRFFFTVAGVNADQRKNLGAGGGWNAYEFCLKEFAPR